MNNLKQFETIPVDFYALTNALHNYSYPADKISALEKDGAIIRLKKGLFVISEKISGNRISHELVANHLYGPSYISLEYALSWYGLIPERVHTIRSLTPKRSRSFSNKLGRFDYITTSQEYFHIGIRQVETDQSHFFMMASPEKAICDMIAYTRNLRIQSVKSMQEYLENDLRIDGEELEKLDGAIILQCARYGKKKNELNYLLKLLGI
jgi:predicted transcriptional regulator of viral defense system